jgi:hypothetical protein
MLFLAAARKRLQPPVRFSLNAVCVRAHLSPGAQLMHHLFISGRTKTHSLTSRRAESGALFHPPHARASGYGGWYLILNFSISKAYVPLPAA